MNNRLPRTAAAVAATLFGVFVVGQGSAAARSHCGLAGSHTIRHSSIGRVFSKSGRYYGCLFSRDHRYRLPVHSRHDAVDHFRLAGQFVAYADRVCSDDGGVGLLCGITVHVIRLSNGSSRHTDHAQPEYAEGDTYGFADRLILLSDGDLAWSYNQTGGLVGPDPQIRKSDSDGEHIVLDHTTSYPDPDAYPDTHSLTLGPHGNLHWIRKVYDTTTSTYNDEPHSAPLN